MIKKKNILQFEYIFFQLKTVQVGCLKERKKERKKIVAREINFSLSVLL